MWFKKACLFFRPFTPLSKFIIPSAEYEKPPQIELSCFSFFNEFSSKVLRIDLIPLVPSFLPFFLLIRALFYRSHCGGLGASLSFVFVFGILFVA